MPQARKRLEEAAFFQTPKRGGTNAKRHAELACAVGEFIDLLVRGVLRMRHRFVRDALALFERDLESYTSRLSCNFRSTSLSETSEPALT